MHLPMKYNLGHWLITMNDQKLWESRKDNPAFKKSLIRILILIGLFPWSLLALFLYGSSLDYDRIDAKAEEWQFIITNEYPAEFAALCFIIVILGCIALAKKKMR